MPFKLKIIQYYIFTESVLLNKRFLYHLLVKISREHVGIRAEISVSSYIEPTTPFTKLLCQVTIVRAEQSGPLKKPSRVAQSNSCGTDCRNFAVSSTAVNSCWSLLQQETITEGCP